MRVTKSITKHRKHKKILKKVRGMQHARTRSYRLAKQAVNRSLEYSYRDRRNRKRDFRQLWITRVSNACRENGQKYSSFIFFLKQNNVELDRKILSDIAVTDPVAFSTLTEKIKA